jgi:hypothetical protein
MSTNAHEREGASTSRTGQQPTTDLSLHRAATPTLHHTAQGIYIIVHAADEPTNPSADPNRRSATHCKAGHCGEEIAQAHEARLLTDDEVPNRMCSVNCALQCVKSTEFISDYAI